MLPLFVALARAETFERKANEHVAPVFWTSKSHKRMFECVVVARQFGEERCRYFPQSPRQKTVAIELLELPLTVKRIFLFAGVCHEGKYRIQRVDLE